MTTTHQPTECPIPDCPCQTWNQQSNTYPELDAALTEEDKQLIIGAMPLQVFPLPQYLVLAARDNRDCNDICPECNGSGRWADDKVAAPCPACNSTGQLIRKCGDINSHYSTCPLYTNRQDAPLVQLPLERASQVELWIDSNRCTVSYHEFSRPEQGLPLKVHHADGSLCDEVEFRFWPETGYVSGRTER